MTLYFHSCTFEDGESNVGDTPDPEDLERSLSSVDSSLQSFEEAATRVRKVCHEVSSKYAESMKLSSGKDASIIDGARLRVQSHFGGTFMSTKLLKALPDYINISFSHFIFSFLYHEALEHVRLRLTLSQRIATRTSCISL